MDLVPPGRTVVEVGCDHGHTAHALGAIGTERRVHRLPRRDDLRLVVADGLRCFRRVDVAVITGIGAWQIGRILSDGPRPEIAVVHAPDRPGWLRCWCAAHGWRIDAERLAPEGGRFAEVMRVVPGDEPHTGLELAFGPKLAMDPLVRPHAEQLVGYWTAILARVKPHSPAKAAEAQAWLDFLSEFLTQATNPSGLLVDSSPPQF